MQEAKRCVVHCESAYRHRPKYLFTLLVKLEERGQPYLFKMRQTLGVKKLLTRQFARDDWSTAEPISGLECG